MLKLTFGYSVTDVDRHVEITTRRGRLRYSPELFAPIEWIEPGAAAWARFAADAALFGVWSWAPGYYEYAGEAGVLWCLTLRDDARLLETAGYTTFPAAFPLLCGALEALAGRQLFDEWDRDTMRNFLARGPRAEADPAAIKHWRKVVIDPPDPADPVEDWRDFLDEARRFPGDEPWIDRHIETADD